MMRDALVLVGVILLLGGCAGWPPAGAPEPTSYAPPEEAVQTAELLAEQGQWSAALALIDGARVAHPDAVVLADSATRLAQRWDLEKAALEDGILVSDAENQREKLVLLDRLVQAMPDNLMLVSRRRYWKEILASKLDELTRCAERHLERGPELARRCHAVARELVATPPLAERLAEVQRRFEEAENAATAKRRALEQAQRQKKIQGLLQSARAAIEGGRFRHALDLASQVEALQPGNQEARELQDTAWGMIGPQVDALVRLGDHLYLNEQLAAAVATWQAALRLNPDVEELAARIERARAVLAKLRELREQQGYTSDAD